DEDVTVVYTITQTDLNAGSFVNTASALVPDPTDPVNNPPLVPSEPSNPVTVDGDQKPSVTVLKSVTSVTDAANTGRASGKFEAVGDKITYTITVTNTGNIPLNNIAVSDPAITG